MSVFYVETWCRIERGCIRGKVEETHESNGGGEYMRLRNLRGGHELTEWQTVTIISAGVTT